MPLMSIFRQGDVEKLLATQCNNFILPCTDWPSLATGPLSSSFTKHLRFVKDDIS